MKLLLSLLALLVIGAAAWILRGIHDRHSLMEGRVLVVNADGAGHRVGLAFPSGESVSVTLPPSGSREISIGGTGEGAIAVSIDGRARDEVGYVTSHNGLLVLVVGEERTILTQVFPGRPAGPTDP